MTSSSDGVGTVTIVGIALSASLVPLNSTMIAVALPEIADDLDVSTGTTGVLVIVYLITMLLGQPASGWLGDRVGSRRMLIVGLVGMGIASIAAAAAGSFTALVAARVAQAVFGAMLMPNVQAILRAVSRPNQRGRNFGLLSSVLGGGAAIGPLVGGLVIALAGWEAVFLVNVPVIIVILAIVTRVAPVREPTEVATDTSAATTGRIFNRAFTGAFGSHAAATLAQYVILLLVPLVLDERGWSSAGIGLALTTFTVGMVIMGPIGGRVGDERGRRLPARVGIMALAAAAVALAVAGPTAHPALIILCISVFGIGFGFATPSLMTAALESVPDARTATAGGIFQTSRYAGSIPASILFALVIDEGISGVGTVFIVAAAASVLAIATTGLLPTKPRSVS